MVRAAVLADLPGLLLVLQALGSNGADYTADRAEAGFAALLASGVATVVVAEVDGVVASTCTLVVAPNLTHWGAPYGVIENVATLASHRRAGLGRLVLAHACGLAWGAGCYKVSLSTGSVQDATLRFYEGAGFTRNSKTFFEMRRGLGSSGLG